MAVTNQLSLCMPDLGLVRLIVQFQTLWKLVNGLMSCAPNLEMLIGKPVTGKRSEAAKDNNLQPTDAMGKKTRVFFMMFFPFVDSKPGQYSILDVLVDEYPFIHRCPVWVGTSVGFRFPHSFGWEPDESGNNSGWIYVIMTCPCHRITLTISQSSS